MECVKIFVSFLHEPGSIQTRLTIFDSFQMLVVIISRLSSCICFSVAFYMRKLFVSSNFKKVWNDILFDTQKRLVSHLLLESEKIFEKLKKELQQKLTEIFPESS